MIHSDTVTLFTPVDRDGFDVIWRKFVLKNVTLETTHSEDGDTALLYLFYDKAKFYRGGKRIPAFKIREGCAVMRGDYGASEEFVIGLPHRGVLRVVTSEHFIRGNLSIHHTKLTLK